MHHPHFKLRLACILAAFSLFSPALAPAELPDLVPKTVLFGGGDEKFRFRISGDGAFLTYFGPTNDGKLGLFKQTPDLQAPVLISDSAPLGRGMTWGADNRHYFYLRDTNGDENFHLWAFNIETKTGRDLTPFGAVKAQNLLISPNRPNEILVGLNRRDSRVFDMHRVNLKTYEVVLDTQNPGNIRWWAADRDLVVRAAVTCNAENADMSLLLRDGAGAPWRTLKNFPFGTSGHLEGYGSEIVIGFSPDGRELILNAAFDGDHTSLARVDARTGDVVKIVASDPRASVWTLMGPTLYNEAQVLCHPETGQVQAAAFDFQIPEWMVVDPALGPDFEALRSARPGVIYIQDRDRKDRYWVVEYDDDDQPGGVYLYDRKTKSLRLLQATNTVLTKFRPAATEPVVFQARDGMEIPAYLTLPPGLDPKNLPLVLEIHGGPWARDEWGYSPRNQWLANRGYAVLNVNFRGSAGFGNRFLNAGIGQWGVGSMQHDISDAVAWAVARGLADPKRVAIIGGSYGGYASLCGMTFTPDLFACGIVICGISNIKTFFETLPSWWGPIRTRWLRRIGIDLADDAGIRRISPFFHADRVKSPMMIFHGANDPRVKIAEAEQIVKVLRANRRSVDFIVYPNAGHGDWGGSDAMEELARTEAFLAKYIGGRAEPAAPVAGSSAQVR